MLVGGKNRMFHILLPWFIESPHPEELSCSCLIAAHLKVIPTRKGKDTCFLYLWCVTWSECNTASRHTSSVFYMWAKLFDSNLFIMQLHKDSDSDSWGSCRTHSVCDTPVLLEVLIMAAWQNSSNATGKTYSLQKSLAQNSWKEHPRNSIADKQCRLMIRSLKCSWTTALVITKRYQGTVLDSS